ncbi:MAG TPA: hypothetical protein VH661_10655 [Candidatus Dormibacteraeota bacterium]|nr:hypothetical protein [Candidatus Dormibacteraeota bacterium]
MRRQRITLTVGGLVTAAVMAAILPLVVRRVGDADYWWHIVTARWILDHGALPAHDLFTYTVPDHPWTDHEYLSELLMYGLGRVGGQLGVSLGLGAVTWAGFWLILKRINLYRQPYVATAAALALGAVAGVAVWGPRPQMITFAFICLELYLIERLLSGRGRELYAMPLVVLVWANFHGGFIIAFLFLGIAVLVEGARWLFDRDNSQARTHAFRIAVISVASAVAGLVNPHGIALYAYSWRTQTSGVQQAFITEWQSPDFHSLSMRGLEAMIILLLVGLAVRRGRFTAFQVLVAVAGLVLALQSVRHIAVFVAAATPLLAWAWGPVLGGLWHRSRGLVSRISLRPQEALVAAALLAAAVAVTALVALKVLLGHQAASTVENFPSGAADYLDAHPSTGTHMFSDYGWGGYMIYRFYPDPNRRVFIFGEADLMGDTIMNEYSDVVGLKSDWLDILNAHGVDYVVYDPNTALTSALATQTNWHQVYADRVAVIFVRG